VVDWLHLWTRHWLDNDLEVISHTLALKLNIISPSETDFRGRVVVGADMLAAPLGRMSGGRRP
jgi:hypothetical protein